MILFQLHYICYHIYCQSPSPSLAALGPNHTCASSSPFTANTHTVKHNSCWSHALANKRRILQQNIRSCDLIEQSVLRCARRANHGLQSKMAEVGHVKEHERQSPALTDDWFLLSVWSWRMIPWRVRQNYPFLLSK